MATDSEIRRRVTRLENETESIYELITEIRSTQLQHGVHLHQHDHRFDQIDTTLQALTTSVREVVRRLPEPPS